MNRSIILILMVAIVGVLSISTLAAEGVQESSDGSTTTQYSYYNSERVRVSGTVELSASEAELKTGDGKEYEVATSYSPGYGPQSSGYGPGAGGMRGRGPGMMGGPAAGSRW